MCMYFHNIYQIMCWSLTYVNQSDEDKVLDTTTKRHDHSPSPNNEPRPETTARTPDAGMKVAQASLHQKRRNPK